MRLLLLAISLLLFGLVGCQSNNVSVDYDTQANFSNYSFYKWHKAPNAVKEGVENLQDDPLISARVKNAVAKQLQQHGISPASTSQTPDVLIHHLVTSEAYTEAPKSRGSIGLGRAGGNTGVGLAIQLPLGKESAKKQVSILVDLIDATDKKLKWRGSKTLILANETPEQINAAIENSIADIFSRYPPGAGQQ